MKSRNWRKIDREERNYGNKGLSFREAQRISDENMLGCIPELILAVCGQFPDLSALLMATTNCIYGTVGLKNEISKKLK